MFIFITCLLLLIFWNFSSGQEDVNGPSRSRSLWVAYTEGFDEHRTSTECRELYKYHEAGGVIDETNKYKLWPGLILGPDQTTGEKLFGLEDALERVWQTQHPADCSTANYLLAESWYQGFGSEVHVLGVGLAIAVATNRVFLQDPKDVRSWRIKVPHCEEQGKQNSECYFEPWSKCTLEDAYASIAKEANRPKLVKPASGLRWTPEEDALLKQLFLDHGMQGDWGKVAEGIPGRSENECLIRWKKHGKSKLMQEKMDAMMHSNSPGVRQEFHNLQQTIFSNNKDIGTKYGVFRIPKLTTMAKPEHNQAHPQVMALSMDLMLNERNFVPPQFRQLLSCSPIPPEYWRFWWRSVAAAYILRPNEATLQLIRQYRDPVVHSSEGHCVSTYIRHGDKSSEMKLVPFDRYAQNIEEIWKKGYLYEDLGDYKLTSAAKQKKVLYYSTETDSVVTAVKEWASKSQGQASIRTANLTHHIIERRSQFKTHELEYISYLVNLENIVKCRISICTYLSNFCRVVDELRATVGGKANRYYAEVNSEICPLGEFCIKKDMMISNDTLFRELDPRLW